MKRRLVHLLGYLVIATLAVALAGVAGYGPLQDLKKDDPEAVKVDGGTADAAGGVTTSTIRNFALRSYEPGQCVTWNQQNVGRTDTEVVDCSKPHLLQIAGQASGAQFKEFPTPVQWSAFFDKECGRVAATLLGAPVDPMGWYYPSGLLPAPETWATSDRTVWCGLEKTGDHPPAVKDEPVPWVGTVDRATQARIAPVGTCWTSGERYSVACDKAHEWEVTGTVDLSGRVQALPPEGAYQDLVGNECVRIGTQYMGHAPVDDQGAGWLPIQPGSWNAGRRIVECTVSRYRNGNTIPMVGSLKG